MSPGGHPHMANNEREQDSHGEAAGVFTTTHWSMIWRARAQNSPASAEAREKLCRAYWAPLYAYIRRDGHRPHDAQDLTQEFLSRFLHQDGLEHLKDQRG